MTKYPFYNAAAALAYIVSIILLIFFAGPFMGMDNGDATILIPIVMLSLFVLSAAIMSYLFFYKPVLLLLDGKREEGTKLFLQTVVMFAMGTFLLLIVALGISRWE